jgi:hypothetical protein
MKLTPADIVGILGMVPTPSTPDADKWWCEASVDLDETAKMVEFVVGGGIRILLTNGSLGEGATLTAAEHRAFNGCIADTLRGRGLLFAGVTTLNTRDTIARARAAVDAGADGLFLGRPMWMSLDPPSIVRYYRDVAEALPGVPMVLYDNQFAFKAKIDTPTYAELSRIPEIIGTKHIGGPTMADDLLATEGRMRILPLDTQWAALAKRFPEARPAGPAMQPTGRNRCWRWPPPSARGTGSGPTRSRPAWPGRRRRCSRAESWRTSSTTTSRSPMPGSRVRASSGPAPRARPTRPPPRDTSKAGGRRGGAGPRYGANSPRAEVNSASTPPGSARRSLCPWRRRASRLGRLLVARLPGKPEAKGLLSLMLHAAFAGFGFAIGKVNVRAVRVLA